MSRSNYDKPFYVYVGTSVAVIKCSSNHEDVFSIDLEISKLSRESIIESCEKICDRMNKEFELYAQSKAADTKPTCDWSVKDALNFANTLANHGFTREATAYAASSCIYALCRLLKDGGNTAAMREALNDVISIADREFNAFRETAAMKEMRDKCCAAISAPPRNCKAALEVKDVR